MNVREVDPRDTRWEIDQPTFRVYFWKINAPSPQPGVPDSYESTEYEVSEADIKEVLRWADDYAKRDKTDHCTVYLRVEAPEGPGLVRLFGTDPTE